MIIYVAEDIPFKLYLFLAVIFIYSFAEDIPVLSYNVLNKNAPPFFKQNQNIFAFHFSVNNSIHYYSLQCCLLVVVNIILYYTHHKDLASNIWSTTIKEIHQRKLQIFQSCRQYYQFLMIKTTAVFLVLLCAALECSI